MKHLLTLDDWSPEDVAASVELAAHIKAHPAAYADSMARKVLFMVFEKPSLRTRVSFETGMARMGGYAINYDTSTSPLGAGKESLEDTIRVVSRYADLIVARLYKHTDLDKMAAHSSVPVINGLTDLAHPCQILADLLTITEKKGALRGLTLCYLGDSNNNVTHSLMYGCAMTGMNIRIGCPADAVYLPQPAVTTRARQLAAARGARVDVFADAGEAACGADVVYTDSWMSYHIPPAELAARVAALQPFQVTAGVMARAKRDAVFMNCLPAARGYEQTAEVIDGPQSIVFDQAENRLYAQNAVMLQLLRAAGR
ncbi:MAG: ornithine carbamoyltransferase [Kiritimatiellia bacterium]